MAVDDNLSTLWTNHAFERTFFLFVLVLVKHSDLLTTQVRTVNYSVLAFSFHVPKKVSVRKIEATTVVRTLKLCSLKHAHDCLARLSATKQT